MLALQRRVGNQAVQQMLDKKKRSIRKQAESALQTRGGDLVDKQEAAPQQREDAVKAPTSPAEQDHGEQAQPKQKPQSGSTAERANESSQLARAKDQPEQGAGQDKPAPNALPASPVASIKQAAGAALGGAVSKAKSAAKPSPVIKAAAALATGATATGAATQAATAAPTEAEAASAQAAAPEAPAMAGGEAEGSPAGAEDPALEEVAALSQQVESPPQEDYSAALDSVGESVGGAGGGGGGGGGGSAIANKPVPPTPNVAAAPPAQAMGALQGLPPLQLHEALGGVSASAANFVDKEQAQLAAQPPQMQRPSGSPAQHGAPATRPDLPGPKGDAKVERASEGKATPVAKPKPLPAAPPNPAQRAAPPVETKDLPSSISNIPTTDPGMALKAGPAPTVELTGNADPNKTEEQQAKLLSSVQKTHGEGKADAAQPMGENDIFPVVPAEMLKADVPGGAGAGAAGKAHAAVGAAADMDGQGLAVSAIAQEQSGPAIQSAVAKAQGDINAKQQEHATKVTSERAKSSQEIDQLIVDNSSAQTTERTKALSEVQQQRSHWNQEQTKLVTDAQAESTKAKAEGLQTIQQEQAQADQEAAQHIEQGNAEAAEAQRQGEAEAKQEQERGKSEANSGGFFGWLADKAKGFFDGIKQAIKAAIDKARALVRSVIEKAKQLAVAVIEKARQAVVAVIRKVGDTLIAIGDRVLAGFPALRDKFRNAIKSAVQKAEQAVNALADKLKDNVKKALDRIAKTIDSALNLLEKGLMAVVDGVKSVVDNAIKTAKAFISALGAFAAIIGDIVPNPGQWLSNLGKGATDGVKNHLWNAFQTQVKTWFQNKVEQVLGLGQAVWTLLKKGGITMAQIVSMVWQALQEMIPAILRDLLIEKLISMIVPAAGTVKLIIEGLQAAWGSISSIIQAIDQFVKFLKAVKSGNAGPAFAGALAAAAVAVIDFVSNWLLQRIRGKTGGVTSKIRALAQKIGRGLTRTLGKVGKRIGNAMSKVRNRFDRRRTPERKQDDMRAKQERLDRAVRELTPKVLGLLSRGTSGLLFRARLAAWKIQYRLTRLETQGSGDNVRVIATVNPSKDVVRDIVEAHGPHVLRTIREVGRELLNSKEAQEHFEGIMQQRARQRGRDASNPIEHGSGYRFMAMATETHNMYTPRTDDAIREGRIRTRGQTEHLNISGAQVSERQSYSSLPGHVHVGGIGGGGTYDDVVALWQTVKQSSQYPDTEIAKAILRFQQTGHLDPNLLAHRDRIGSLGRLMTTEMGRNPGHVVNGQLLLDLMSSGHITAAQGLRDMNPMAPAGAVRTSNAITESVGLNPEKTYSTRAVPERVRQMQEAELNVMIQYLSSKMQIDKPMFRNAQQLEQFIRKELRDYLRVIIRQGFTGRE
ncbi:MAG TPA: hypothetical protein VGD58_11385 [Herpetosiphonaceae bacterium]